ncbi:hypothetical protein CVT25_007787, partial [Psilocybe cyanescens]
RDSNTITHISPHSPHPTSSDPSIHPYPHLTHPHIYPITRHTAPCPHPHPCNSSFSSDPTLRPRTPCPCAVPVPLNDTWALKHTALTNLHTKIGRQTSSKTAPGQRNGFFDSKVLSRQHAEVWEEGGKIYIKDVKSSNGTFINGERLSSEGHESDPFELNSDDIVELGIHIVGEDNKTIIHHRVAARVVCVFTEQDTQVAARAEQQQQHFMQQQQMHRGVAGGGGGLHGQQHPGDGRGVGRPANLPSFPPHLPLVRAPLPDVAQLPSPSQSSAAAGTTAPSAAGGSPTAPVAVPGSIQTEAAGKEKEKEGVETSTSPSPPPAATTSTSSRADDNVHGPALPAGIIQDLQSQLRDTQARLVGHLERVCQLEGVLQEQEAMRREVGVLREMIMHEHGHEEDNEEHDSEEGEEEDIEEDDNDDDTRSISTVVPHELESVEEEDEEELARAERGEDGHGQNVEGAQVERGAPAEVVVHGSVEGAQHEQEEGETEEDANAEEEAEERRREDLGVGRPRTPEPSMLGMGMSDRSRRASVSSPLAWRRVESHEGEDGESESESDVEAEHHEQRHEDSDREGAVHERSSDGDVLKQQVTKLALQVSSAVALTAALEQQHALAQGTIRGLESKVEELEGLLRAAAAAAVPTSSAADVSATKTETEAEAEATPEHDDDDALTHTLAEKMQLWKKAVEGQWSAVREEWADERARLGRAREEWEARARLVEFGLEQMRAAEAVVAGAGVGGEREEEEWSKSHARGGLVTPPSSRSQSSGSDSGRYKRRKKRAAVAAAAAAGSGSGSASEGEGDGEVSDGEEEGALKEKAVVGIGNVLDPERSLATPEPSVVFKLSESATSSLDDGESAKGRHHHPLSVDSSGLDLDGNSVSGHHADEDEDEDDEQGDEESRASVFYSTFAKDALLILFRVFISFWVWVWSGLVFAWTVVLPSWVSSMSSSWASSLPTAWVSSVRGHVHLPMSSSVIWDWVVQALNGKLSSSTSSHAKDRDSNNRINMQTAVGVALLSVAAAAVFGKIKPE